MASNIDKVLVNQDFMRLLPIVSPIALPTTLSDHTPIYFHFQKLNIKRIYFSGMEYLVYF